MARAAALSPPGADGYTHVLPPIFLNNRYSDGTHYTHLLPLFSCWRSTLYGLIPGGKKYETPYSAGLLTPLFGHITLRYGENRWSGSPADSIFWFPIIPLYYQSRDARKGTHRNLLWVFDWHTAPEGTLERFWLIPFIFHEAGDSGYRFYFPFYMRLPGSNRKESTSFGLFHYNKRTPDESVRWCLIHFAWSAPARGEEASYWLPLYYHDKTPERDITLFLPLYFDYESPNRELHINILGMSKSVAAGPAPSVGLGLGRGERGWHVDTELSWLYDVVSVSTRVTLARPPRQGEPASPTGEAPVETPAAGTPDGGVQIREKKTVSRENSEYFWGFRLLFGLTAFEMADSKRHFRLLPLSWLTWDKNSEDRVKWVLNYLSYKSGEVEYLVFFPLYGMQREGRSFKRGYALNLYWDEYDATNELRERTVLWPIVNWYSSPVKSGWRIFPLIWHRERREDGILSKSTISPLYYGASATAEDATKFSRSFSISPLHCAKSEIADGRTAGFSSSRSFRLLPLDRQRRYAHNVLWLVDRARSADGADSRLWVLPFYLARTSPQKSYRTYSRSFTLPRRRGMNTRSRCSCGGAPTPARANGRCISSALLLLALRAGINALHPATLFLVAIGKLLQPFHSGSLPALSPAYNRQNFLGLFDRREWTVPGTSSTASRSIY